MGQFKILRVRVEFWLEVSGSGLSGFIYTIFFGFERVRALGREYLSGSGLRPSGFRAFGFKKLVQFFGIFHMF